MSVKLPEKPWLYINGDFVEASSKRRFQDVAPASDEVIAEVAHAGQDDLERAVEAARHALAGPWGKSTPAERAALLRRIADGIDARREELARLEAHDTGKPVSETFYGDIPRAASNFRFFADLVMTQPTPSFTGEDGSLHLTERFPVGIVGLITPWNLPLYLATWKLAPALAQGNAAILKPAELTPLSAIVLGEILSEAGVPAGVVNILQGFGAGDIGQHIVEHPEIRAISFTGETLTGEAIMRAAAPHLKKLSFELGGKGATVICADADLEKAAATAARAAFRNQGQICLAGSRLLVERQVADEVVGRILEHVSEIRLGDPLDANTTMGSLISREHRDKVASYVDLARGQDGVELLCGGRIPFDKGAYYEPTIITGLHQDSRLIQEEIFGPVLTVQTFETEDEALNLLNGTLYGLSCSIFTENGAKARRMAHGARTGLVWINSWFLRHLGSAFGGTKRSGIGREGGQWSLDFFSEVKTISMPGLNG